METSNILKKRIEAFKNATIYPVVSSEFTLGRNVIDVVKEIVSGGGKIVQLREKHANKKDLYEIAVACRKITSKSNCLLIINDHVDVALAVNADGVHLGQDDLPIMAGKRIAPDLLLGCSTHNLIEALEAEKAGASYINIGPIYSTSTKELSMQPLGVEAIETISSKITVPFSVMGGIKRHHIPTLHKVGAKCIAMVTEITQSENIALTLKELIEIQ